MAAGGAYLLFFALALVAPGIALQRLARVPVDPALVLPLGSAFSAGAYWLSLVSHAPWIFPLAVAAVVVAALVRPGHLRAAPGPAWRGAVAPSLAIVALFAFTQYRWNVAAPEGDFAIDPFLAPDTAFHVGVARELTLGYPPQVPGLAGFPLGYHVGFDLLRAAALRWARVDPFDSIARFDVTWAALALLLALRGAATRAGLPPAAVAFVPWTLLLCDLSWLLAGNPQAHWWCDLLRGNLLISLCAANPAIPALALALGSLIALSRHASGEGRGWLALAAFQAAAVPHFKVFLGAHLLLGFAAVWILRRETRLSVLATALPCAISTAMLALGRGGESVSVAFAPLDLVLATRETLGLDPLRGAALFGFAAFWILASLGLRAFGLAHAWRALRQTDPAAGALGAMALSGWPLGLLFRVAAPDVLPGERVINDAAYLVEQSGPLLWIFTAAGLVAFARRPWRRIAVAVGVASALPASVHFALEKATLAPDPLPAATVRAARALEPLTHPGEVVLQRPGGRYAPAPVVLSGRRVAYDRFTPYLTQFAPRGELERRHELVARFFRTRDAREARAIASSLGARYVCLYGGERVRFPREGVLEPVHEEEGARIYRLIAPHAPAER